MDYSLCPLGVFSRVIFFTDNIKDEPPGPNLSGPVRGVRSRLGGRASVNVTSPGFLQPLALGLPELDSQVTR